MFSELKQKVTRYIEVNIKLAKLSFIERSANVFSYFLFALICLFLCFCIFLFIGFGLTEVFIEAGLSKMVSFFVVIGIYVLFLLIIVGLRKRITRFFSNGFVNVLTEGDDADKKKE